MSHFYGDLTGSRGSATRCGTPSSGITSHPRGWNLGVSVDGLVDGFTNGDRFYIAATSGSNGHTRLPFAWVERYADGWKVELKRPDGTTETLIYDS